MDLTLPVGARVALVGPSGGGKSTIASLLLGLHIPQAGGVQIDGEILSPSELPAWQSRCSEVSQPVRLLNGTVIDNVLFRPGGGGGPSPPPSQEGEVWQVLEAACLAADIRRLPEGLHTRIGEDGQRLSGGQRQRLALARALWQRPAFLVLDEATSAIDQRTESAILRTLSLLDERTTVLLIAHRPSLMRHCDRIDELRDGRIVASGTYSELLERSPSFAELINRRIPVLESQAPGSLPTKGIH
jgi:ATP-binding cassette subfamily B protein